MVFDGAKIRKFQVEMLYEFQGTLYLDYQTPDEVYKKVS